MGHSVSTTSMGPYWLLLCCSAPSSSSGSGLHLMTWRVMKSSPFSQVWPIHCQFRLLVNTSTTTDPQAEVVLCWWLCRARVSQWRRQEFRKLSNFWKTMVTFMCCSHMAEGREYCHGKVNVWCWYIYLFNLKNTTQNSEFPNTYYLRGRSKLVASSTLKTNKSKKNRFEKIRRLLLFR